MGDLDEVDCLSLPWSLYPFVKVLETLHDELEVGKHRGETAGFRIEGRRLLDEPINTLHEGPQYDSIKQVAEAVALLGYFEASNEVNDGLVGGIGAFNHVRNVNVG